MSYSNSVEQHGDQSAANKEEVTERPVSPQELVKLLNNTVENTIQQGDTKIVGLGQQILATRQDPSHFSDHVRARLEDWRARVPELLEQMEQTALQTVTDSLVIYQIANSYLQGKHTVSVVNRPSLANADLEQSYLNLNAANIQLTPTDLQSSDLEDNPISTEEKTLTSEEIIRLQANTAQFVFKEDALQLLDTVRDIRSGKVNQEETALLIDLANRFTERGFRFRDSSTAALNRHPVTVATQGGRQFLLLS